MEHEGLVMDQSIKINKVIDLWKVLDHGHVAQMHPFELGGEDELSVRFVVFEETGDGIPTYQQW